MGWFKPRCPLDDLAKRWVESRLRWLADEFGSDVFTRRAVVLPLFEFFPDAYDGTEPTVRTMFHRVCRYMDVDDDAVRLKLTVQPPPLGLVNAAGLDVASGFAGLYGDDPDDDEDDWDIDADNRPTITLEVGWQADPMDLVGTMAHELAHERLLGEDRLPYDAYDNELLTDLTVVFHGLGIFLANSPRAWPSQFSNWPGTQVPRPEYMTGPMFAYALAHQAWHRGERRPAWAKHLEWGVRSTLRQSIRYLWATGDSSFAPGS